MLANVAFAFAVQGVKQTDPLAGIRALAPVCAKYTRPVLYGMQVADLLQMQRNIQVNARNGFRSTEEDSVTRIFTGAHPRSAIGAVLGMATIDVIADALTRRSPALRCAVQLRQIDVEAHALRTLNTPAGPQ